MCLFIYLFIIILRFVGILYFPFNFLINFLILFTLHCSMFRGEFGSFGLYFTCQNKNLDAGAWKLLAFKPAYFKNITNIYFN